MGSLLLPSTSLANALRGELDGPARYLENIIVPVSSVEEARLVLQKFYTNLHVFLNVSTFESIEDVKSVLDSGAATVIVKQSQLEQLDLNNIDQNRVTLLIKATSKQALSNPVGDRNIGLYLSDVGDLELVEVWLSERGTERCPVYVSLIAPTEEDAIKVARRGGIPVLPAQQLSLDAQPTADSINVAKLFTECATTDRPDGLFATLVTDERGYALGLVYSSKESVEESLRKGRGVYQSRKRGLWYKGDSSGDIQELVRISMDCDRDCLRFVVKQLGKGESIGCLMVFKANHLAGFCHLSTYTCFGNATGLLRLQKTLQQRQESAPAGSYTARLFNDPQLLKAKIMEEASELCEATRTEDIAFEAADLLYFALTKCVAAGVSLEDIERNLDQKSLKTKRRQGNAKEKWLPVASTKQMDSSASTVEAIAAATTGTEVPLGKIQLKRLYTGHEDTAKIHDALQRPSQKSTERIMGIVSPIIQAVRERGDTALLEYTHKFEKATTLTSPFLKAPFAPSLMQLSPETVQAIDTSFENIRKFHAAQKEEKPLVVETMRGVTCSRMVRPIERVGLYVPGGTAVLPSTAMMLGVPAMVAGCDKIIIASPPRTDGSISPEIIYIAHKVGAEGIVLAGGAQAIAAMAYGTESVSKVDKILGPGNQFVTAAKMIVSNDTSAAVGIDMPAGPSEVLVVADDTADPAFVASDLLSQAEHGVDSQVVLIAIALTEQQLSAIEEEVDRQANVLPRVDIVREAISHSVTLQVRDVQEAFDLSNHYAPEHLILQIKDAETMVGLVKNAGSVFVGPWTPESVGDYSAGVNHALRKPPFSPDL